MRMTVEGYHFYYDVLEELLYVYHDEADAWYDIGRKQASIVETATEWLLDGGFIE